MTTEAIAMSPGLVHATMTDELTYVGHATTLVRLGGKTILTDPVLGNWIGPLHRQAAIPATELLGSIDLIVVSHLHRDHLDLPSLRRLPAGTPLIVPRGAGSLVARTGLDVEEASRGDRISVGEVTVEVVPARHDPRRGPLGPRAEPVGFLLESERSRVYFPGDTELTPEMWELGCLSAALLPVWGWGPTLGPGHLDPWHAALATRRLRPGVAVPIHWGTLYPVGLRRLRPRPLSEPPLRFARFVSQLAPEVRVRVLRPGGSLSLTTGEG